MLWLGNMGEASLRVIFLCNIDTPGEQQKYIVTSLEELSFYLPPQATIAQVYDVGCVTDHSLRERVCFVINAMHAFGHQWVCQMVYNPCLRRGLCLTDAEGIEHFWSQIRKLIGHDQLGTWISRQQDKNLTRKLAAARKVLQDCGVPRAELRLNWEEQKAAQTSVQSHAPVRLRHELDKVLALQTQIDSIEKSIGDVKQSITGPEASTDSLTLLRSLEHTHDTLNPQAEALYASLNIQNSFPELQALPLELVRTLLIIKAISKRQPALLRSISKFNGYCEDLERLRPPACMIPIPTPLSTRLNTLRDDPSLHEDVWITPAEGQIPRWLNDVDVQDEICALHSADRCAEESVRLNMER
ncbi:hypothetical protein B0H17DRAFT_1160813 [Mycena rosella]|uniref:Uncharacterized protein n=1 Tax=Mycena rosella TaxID=1033263 RepID=A0AAD7D972_MYCRO|nr:hypothetical protein B0H17DRAFT_1160813 [Mycena rosella]